MKTRMKLCANIISFAYLYKVCYNCVKLWLSRILPPVKIPQFKSNWFYQIENWNLDLKVTSGGKITQTQTVWGSLEHDRWLINY